MTEKTTFTVRHRRRRTGRTDYKKRLRLLLSNKPRVIVRRQCGQMTLQLAEFKPEGDSISVTVRSSHLKKYGWKYNLKNMPSSYLTGLLFGKLAQKKLKTKQGEICAVPDIGLHANIKGSKIYAAIKGVRDAGLNVPCSDEVVPNADRLKGQHIVNHAKIASSEKSGSKFQFSKTKVNNITVDFEEIKKKILSE